MFMRWKIQYCEDITSLKLIFKFSNNQNLSEMFVELE